MTDFFFSLLAAALIWMVSVVPLGAATTPGEKRVETWGEYFAELRHALWLLSPVQVCRDFSNDMETGIGALLRIMAGLCSLAGFISGLAVIGFGVYSLFV